MIWVRIIPVKVDRSLTGISRTYVIIHEHAVSRQISDILTWSVARFLKFFSYLGNLAKIRSTWKFCYNPYKIKAKSHRGCHPPCILTRLSYFCMHLTRLPCACMIMASLPISKALGRYLGQSVHMWRNQEGNVFQISASGRKNSFWNFKQAVYAYFIYLLLQLSYYNIFFNLDPEHDHFFSCNCNTNTYTSKQRRFSKVVFD